MNDRNKNKNLKYIRDESVKWLSCALRIFSNSKYITLITETIDLIINENIVDRNMQKTEATSTQREF